ncbi:MAG: hypothetical protein FDZ75_03890, partial [Actinobacteria bacterium]
MPLGARLKRLVALVRGRTPVPDGVTVGRDVHIGPGVRLDWSYGHLITLEDGCVLAPDVIVLAHDASTRRSGG